MHSKNTMDNISCEEAIRLIASYLDMQVSSTDHAALEKHLETCRHCFDRVEFEKLLKTRLRNLKKDVTSERLVGKIDSLLDNF